MTVSFEVPGVPVPQSRPRFTRQGHAYDTQKSRDYKALIRAEAVRKMRGREPFAGAVTASMVFYLPIPKSWSRKKREEAIARWIVPIGRVGDTDNYAKAILDSCNSVVYVDDSQVFHITATKWYSDTPRVYVEIGKLGGLKMSDANFDADLDREERMAIELKPCPFCGREASIRRNLRTGYTAIQCDYCRAWWTPAERLTRNEITEAWNRREKDELRKF